MSQLYTHVENELALELDRKPTEAEIAARVLDYLKRAKLAEEKRKTDKFRTRS